MFGKWKTEYNLKNKTLKIIHNDKILLEWENVQEDDWNTISVNGMDIDVNFCIEETGEWAVNLYRLERAPGGYVQTNCDAWLTIGSGVVNFREMESYRNDNYNCGTNQKTKMPVIEVLSDGRYEKLHGRNGIGHLGKIRVMEDLAYTLYPEFSEMTPPPILIHGFCSSNMNKEGTVSPAGFDLTYETAQALYEALGRVLAQKRERDSKAVK